SAQSAVVMSLASLREFDYGLSARDPAAALIDNALAILLEKFALLRRQKLDHKFGRTAKFYPFGRHHDRPVEEDGMRFDRIEQSVLRKVLIGKAQFAIQWLLVAHERAQRHAGACRELAQQSPRGKSFQIFHDMRLKARIADEAKRVA